MGAPVDLNSQQGTGFGNPFNSLLGNGSNNISKEAVSPLPEWMLLEQLVVKA